MARPKEFNQIDVLQKAMLQFWRKGYFQTSMQDLVDTMGINRASLYAAFTDKHQLYLTCLERYRQQDMDEILEIFNKNETAKAFFNILFDNVIVGLTDDTDRKGCFLTNATLELLPDDVDVQNLVNLNLTFLHEIFEAVLLNSKKVGELNVNKDIKQTADFLINNMYGLRMVGKANPNLTVLNNIKNTALSILN